MALLVSGCVFVAYLLFGFVIHRRQRMGVCSNHIKRFWPATLDALVFRIFSIKKSVIRGLIMTALMLLVCKRLNTSWHEVLPVLIYLLIAVAMFCISKMKIQNRNGLISFGTQRLSLLTLYGSVCLTVIATFAISPTLGELLSGAIMIALFITFLDFLLLANRAKNASSAPVQHTKKEKQTIAE